MSEQRTIKCPFCQQEGVVCNYTPRTLVTKYARAASNKKAMNYFKDEKYVVLSNCPSCGKIKKEIENRLKEGSSMSTSEAARRAKEAGLPTRI